MPIVPGSGFCAMMQEIYLGASSNNSLGIKPEGIRRLIKRNEAGIERARIIAPWSDSIIPLDLTVGTVVMVAQVEYGPHADPEFVIIGLGSNYPSILTAFQSLAIEEIKPEPPKKLIDPDGTKHTIDRTSLFKADEAMLKMSRMQVLQKSGFPEYCITEKMKQNEMSYPVTSHFIEMAFLAGRVFNLPVGLRKLFRKLFGWKKQ